MIQMAEMETARMGSIMPLLAVVTRPEKASQNRSLEAVYHGLRLESTYQFLSFLEALSLMVLICGNIFAVFSRCLPSCCALHHNHPWQTRLLSAYPVHPDTAFLTSSAAPLDKNMLVRVLEVANNVLPPALPLMARFAAALSVLALLRQLSLTPRLA